MSTQDLSEFLSADLAAQLVLDLLEGDPGRGADVVQTGAAHRRPPGRVVSQVVTAAALLT